MVKGGDVAWAGGATRVAKNLGVTPRADVQAIIDAANAETAVLRNQVIGTQVERHPARPDPAARVGDGQPGRRRDARQVPGRRRGVHQLRRPAAGPRLHARRAPARQPCEITWGEMFAVLPFGNRTVIAHATPARSSSRPSSTASRRSATRPSPRAGSRRCPACERRSRCNGTTPVVTGMWKTPDGIGGPQTPIGPTDTVRFVTNDFMFTGGDGYTAFAGGTDVLQPGDDLLQVTIDYVTANSPVNPGGGGPADAELTSPAAPRAGQRRPPGGAASRWRATGVRPAR